MVRKFRPEWAVAFSQAMHDWLNEKSEKRMSSREFARVLDIPLSKWVSAYAGIAITETEYYARVFCYTGLAEADPRTIPPRNQGITGMITRHMTEKMWQQWLLKNGEKYSPKMEQEITPIVPPRPKIPKQVAEQIVATAEALEKLLELDQEYLEEFLAEHGHLLGRLYQSVTMLRIEEPEDRKAALLALRRYGKK